MKANSNMAAGAERVPALSKENYLDLSLYAVLGIDDESAPIDANALQKKYRRLSVVFHPDKDPSVEARNVFERVKLALDTITNEKLRADYDESRRIASSTAVSKGLAARAATDVMRRETEQAELRRRQREEAASKDAAAQAMHQELMGRLKRCPLRTAEEEMLADWEVDEELLDSKRLLVERLLRELEQSAKRWRNGSPVIAS